MFSGRTEFERLVDSPERTVRNHAIESTGSAPGDFTMKKINIKTIIVIFVITLAAAALYFNLSRFVVRVNGDDIVFAEAAGRLTLPQYVSEIFMKFSGRISAKTLEYISGLAPVSLWRVLEALCLAAAGWALYLFFRLFSGKKEWNIPALIGCMLVPLLPHLMTFNEPFLWIAGTTNYSLVIIPGLYFAYLMCSYILVRDLSLWKKIAAVILMVWSCCGSEQAAAVIMCLLLFLNLQSLIKRKHFDGFPLVVFLVSAACFFICHVIAPGTRGRFSYELSQTPDFYTIPILRHANYAVRWFMNAIVNRMGFLFSFTLLLEGALLLLRKDRKKLYVFLAVGCLIFGVLSLLSNFLQKITDFMIGWGRGDFTKISYLLIFVWGISLIFMFFGAFFASDKHGKATALVILAAYSSLLVITLSPSMYPSGYRTGHVSAMLLSCLIVLFSAELITGMKKKFLVSTLLMGAVLLASGMHYWQLYRLVSNGFEAFYGGFIF